MMKDCYTPQQIAAEVGVTPQTVCTYLRERFPSHEYKSHWRLSGETYEFVIGQLKAAQQVGTKQPRRELHRANMLLPLY